jgi:hypothetical protein
MIRNSLLALLLMVGSGNALAIKDIELCQKLSYIAGVGATARDNGVRQSDFYAEIKTALDNDTTGYDQKTRDAFVFFFTVAYALPNNSREDIERDVYSRCIQ